MPNPCLDLKANKSCIVTMGGHLVLQFDPVSISQEDCEGRPLTSSGSESLNSQPSPVQLMNDWHDLSVRSSSKNCHSWMGPLPTDMHLNNAIIHISNAYRAWRCITFILSFELGVSYKKKYIKKIFKHNLVFIIVHWSDGPQFLTPENCKFHSSDISVHSVLKLKIWETLYTYASGYATVWLQRLYVRTWLCEHVGVSIHISLWRPSVINFQCWKVLLFAQNNNQIAHVKCYAQRATRHHS